MEWGAATRPLWAAAYPRLSEGRTGLLGAVTSRAEAQVLRLATLYAIVDSSAAIQPPHLLAALAVWRYCEASARYLFGDSTGDPAADAILEKVRQCPGGVTRLEIRDLLHRHCSGTRLTRILDRLVVEGLLRRAKRTDTGGRPAEVLLPTEATVAGGADPLDIARQLAAERSDTSDVSAESDQSVETPSPVCALRSLSALCPATPPLPPDGPTGDPEDELASPWEPAPDQDLDRALDPDTDPEDTRDDDLALGDDAADEEEDEHEHEDEREHEHEHEHEHAHEPSGSWGAWDMPDDELALDLGPEDDDPADDDLAATGPADGAPWRHEEL